MKKLKFTEHNEPELFRLDLGTGKGANKPDGFIGVDIVKWNGNQVADLRKRWPWKNNSVDEVLANYLVQYFTSDERVHFVNELYRVLKPGAKATIHTPHWASAKSSLDVMAQWPPVSEAWYLTLNKDWRDAQNYVDVSGYKCDFDFTLGYGLHPQIVTRNMEYQQHAVTFWKEAAQELVCTLTKK